MAAYAKAIVGALVAGLGVIGLSLTDESAGGADVTGQEWLAAVIALLVGLGAVFTVPNRPPAP
jgi:protein-S-isoprenylcysteine O-methyltransferase Ste14